METILYILWRIDTSSIIVGAFYISLSLALHFLAKKKVIRVKPTYRPWLLWINAVINIQF